MTPTVTLCETACAKINLYLRVGARRPDGFHDILTLMRGVSLSDTLTCTFQKADETRVSVMAEGADAPLPADEHNLAARGILAVLTAAGETAAVTVRLQKRIPTAAGLGGGSSDAAAAMRATNRWLGGRFSDTELEQMAAAIGSDVPFFVTGRTALCSGRGEKLTPVPAVFDGACVILAGREPSATATAYAALDAARAETAARESAHTQPARISPAYTGISDVTGAFAPAGSEEAGQIMNVSLEFSDTSGKTAENGHNPPAFLPPDGQNALENTAGSPRAILPDEEIQISPVGGTDCSCSLQTVRARTENETDNTVSSLSPLPDFTRFSPADLYNDFEAPVSRLCPSVPLHLAALREAGAIAAAMSGSGSATFGLFPSLVEAESAAAALRDKGFTVFAVALL